MDGEIFQCSKNTRTDVWLKLHGAEFAFRYYERVGNKYLQRYRALRTWTVLLGGGAVIPALAQLIAFFGEGSSPYMVLISGLIGVALAVVSVWNMGEDNSRKTVVAMSISKSCGRVTDELKGLLSEIDQYKIKDSDARERLNGLSERIRLETFSSEPAGIVISKKDDIFEEADDEAHRYMEQLKEFYDNSK